jgi:hypothetical protein
VSGYNFSLFVIHSSETFRGMRLEYLPAYSPYFNPIEEGFSSMKAWLHANRDLVLAELDWTAQCNPLSLLGDAVHNTMTPRSICGWFRHAGYVA